MSILFLLLRFLTAPMPAVTVAAVPAAVVMTDADALRDARGYMATIEGGPARIRTFMRGAQNGPMRMSCVAQRLQEAQVHVVLARDEMKVLADASSETAGARGRDDDRAHALKRLSLMAQRTAEVERAARLCVDDELSTVNATRFETDVPAAVERLGDPTTPPDPVRPCPAGNGCIILP